MPVEDFVTETWSPPRTFTVDPEETRFVVDTTQGLVGKPQYRPVGR